MNRPGPHPVVEVVKPFLGLSIGLSALFGYTMAAKALTVTGLWVGVFVLILAWGAGALNNVQDRAFDAGFDRTRNRALPLKRLNPLHVGIFSGVAILSGIGGLWVLFPLDPFPCFWAMTAVLCYNGLYTPLKKKSLFAIIPGAASGMLPPLIGWSAAGGLALDLKIILIMTIMGLWQIPHFFLIVLKTPREASNTVYTRYPSFARLFPGNGLHLQAMIWCGLYSLGLFLFLIRLKAPLEPAFGVITAANALGILLWTAFRLSRSDPSGAFAGINFSILVFMGTGIMDCLA